MSVLPSALRLALEEALRVRISGAEPVGGGMICEAARVRTADGDIFVKWRADPPPRFFTAEADGLSRIAATKAIRVPAVLAHQDEGVAFLALEWIEPGGPRNMERIAERLGRELAALHRSTLNDRPWFGLEHDNYLGAIPQVNTPHASWLEFYRDRRLMPQIDRARNAGLLPAARERQLTTIVDRVEAILTGLESTPALIHGDLWGGNVLPSADAPVLIDPVVHYAEREIELAYMELFGGYSPRTYAAYNESLPLDEGYEYRRPLHQLYHAVNHLNHFGEEYGPLVDRLCRFYLTGEGPSATAVDL